MKTMGYSFNERYRIWALVAAVLNLSGLALSIMYGVIFPWIAFSIILFGTFILILSSDVPSWPWWIGYANWVSSTRVFMTIFLFALYPYIDRITLFVLFLVVICLDGVDGYLARRYGQTSEAGGKLDSETDAFFVLVLSWIHVDQQNLDWWILIPGGLKYGFEIFFFWVPKGEDEYPPKLIRATIGVIFSLSLISPFILEGSISQAFAAIAGFMVVVSFLATMSGNIYHGYLK